MAHQTAAEGHRQATATSHMSWVWVVELKARESSPFPPRVWCEIGGRGSRLRQRCESGGGQGRIGLRDFHKQLQIRPARREPDYDAAGGDDHFGGDFDDAGAPGADVTFAERVMSAAGVEVSTAAQTRQRLGRQRFRGGDELRWGIGRDFRRGGGRISDPLTLSNQSACGGYASPCISKRK